MALSLAHLDDHILDRILSTTAASSQLISLYLCGYRALNTRLCRGVTTFRLEDELEGRKMTKIPRLLHSMSNLRELAIVGDEWEEKLSETAILLQTLPSTLKKLSIRHVWALDLFCTEFKYVRGDKKKPYHGSRPAAHSILFWDIKTSFPELEALEIDALMESRNWQLLPQDLTVLPRTLKTLNCRHFQFNGMADMTALPSLTSFTATLKTLSVENLSNLPTTLLHLGGRLQTRDVYLSAYPRSLTSLDCSGDEGRASPYSPNTGPEPLSPSKVAVLHTSLQTLHICDIAYKDFDRMGLNWANCLPSKLTCLFISSPVMSLSPLALPRTLTLFSEATPIYLESQRKAASSFFDAAISWPPALTHLATHAPIQFTDIASLPSTMTHLQFTLDCRDNQIEKGAPSISLPNLTTLIISFQQASHNALPIVSTFDSLFKCPLLRLQTLVMASEFELSGFSSLPPNLINLKATVPFSNKAPFSDSHFTDLPRGLSKLRLSFISASALRLLPPYLETAHFDTIRGVISKEDIKGLPSSLSSLNVAFGLPITPSHYTALSALPASLRSLTLRTHLSIDLFKHLSHRIVHLSVHLDVFEDPPTFKTIDKLHARWLHWLTLHLSSKKILLIELCTSKLKHKRWSHKNPY